LGAAVERPALQESTALGAAYLAGLQSGYWTGLDEIVRFRQVERLFEPQMAPSAAQALYKRWQKAVEAVRLFGSE
ncbi:MAG: glycerol kinase, partial [Saprospiraceae bacterium]